MVATSKVLTDGDCRDVLLPMIAVKTTRSHTYRDGRNTFRGDETHELQIRIVK
jgi:hypothetical protein